MKIPSCRSLKKAGRASIAMVSVSSGERHFREMR